MTATVIMQAPSGFGGAVTNVTSGASYAVPANGLVTVAQADVKDFVNLGFIPFPVQNANASGIPTTPLSLFSFKNTNGTTLASSASSGEFGISATSGTSVALTGEAATGATKTDTATIIVPVPPTFISGQSLTVTVEAAYSGSGTVGTATVAVAAYGISAAGGMSALTVAQSATTITTSNAAYAFTVSGATANQNIALNVQCVMQETGGSSSLTASVKSVTIG